MEDRRLQDDRVVRWDAFREACDVEEQRWLDGLIDALVQAAHARRAKNFGISAAKEVLIALLDLDVRMNQEFERQRALEARYGHRNR